MTDAGAAPRSVAEASSRTTLGPWQADTDRQRRAASWPVRCEAPMSAVTQDAANAATAAFTAPFARVRVVPAQKALRRGVRLWRRADFLVIKR